MSSDAAEVKTRDLPPRKGNSLALDAHEHSLAVGILDLAEELVADDEPGLVLLDVQLEACRGFGEPNQLKVVDMAHGHLGYVERRRIGRGSRTADPHRDERTIRPLAVRQVLTVYRDLGLLGAKAKCQSVPSRRSGEALHRQCREDRHFDRQAIVRPAGNHAQQPRASLALEREIDRPLAPGATSPSSW